MLRIRSPIPSPSSRKGEAICGGKKCETYISYCSYCYNSNSLCGSTIKYSNHNKKSTGNFFQFVFLQTWVIRARWREIRRFVLEFKAR